MSEENTTPPPIEQPLAAAGIEVPQTVIAPAAPVVATVASEPPKPVEIQLTTEQETGILTIINWLDNEPKQEFKFGGNAGTGKTTIIKSLLKRLKDIDIRVAAFTGKACNVLQRKGVTAQTLHSLMYDVSIDKDGYHFTKRSVLAGSPNLVIVDEASMVSTQLYEDLKSFDIKILFVGDPAQLEPVGDNPDLMKHCDFVLSKIHRQAEKSPIIRLATEIRNRQPMPKSRKEEGLHVRDKTITMGSLLGFDQVLCARNKSRQQFNGKIRELKGMPYRSIAKGEKIIVLRNNMGFGVFNGMILFIDEIVDDSNQLFWEVNCHDETGAKFNGLWLWKEPFVTPQGEKKQDLQIPKYQKRTLVYADYGYVITCHKSQGSEWKSVCCFDEWMPPAVWDMARWRYTAITRASEKLTYCV